jgi:guanylate kinase
MSGRLYVVAAPSGAGKTTLVRLLLDSEPEVHLSISYTTRDPRAGRAGWARIPLRRRGDLSRIDARPQASSSSGHDVHGNYYATSKKGSGSKAQLATAGRDTLLEIDWQGAQQVRKHFPDAVGVFILPPSMEALAARLVRARHRQRRCHQPPPARRARTKCVMWHEFDYVIINDEI